MTLAQLVSRCKLRFRDLSNMLVTDDGWKAHINEGYREMLGASSFWPFLEASTPALSIAAGVNSVALPTDVWKVLAVYNNTDKIPMDELAGRRGGYDAFPLLAGQTGVPEHYRLYGNALQVFPYPAVTTTFLVEYAVAPADLANDAAVPVFPAQYHQALVYYALAAAYEDDKRKSEPFTERFLHTLAKMQIDLLGARGDSYPAIQDSFF